MAADVEIKRWTGDVGSPTNTDIKDATTRASTSDDPSPGDDNPIPIPDSGDPDNYSFWVTTRLHAVTSPSGKIDNIKWYTDGSNGLGTGVSCVVGLATGYVQATGVVGDSGDELNTVNHADLKANPEDAFDYEDASPLAVGGEIENPDTGDFGEFVVCQIVVDDTAGPGTTPAETFTFQYDET